MTTGRNIALTRWTFVSKVMSLLFNDGRNIALTRWTFVSKVMSLLFMTKLSSLVIAFLPRMLFVQASFLFKDGPL